MPAPPVHPAGCKATVCTDFAKCRDVGADNAASCEKRFRNREAEAFNERWRKQERAIAIAPLQLLIGEAIQQKDAVSDASGREKWRIAFVSGPGIPTMTRRVCCGDAVRAQQALEDAQKEEQVLVAAMLRDTQQERLAAPLRQRTGRGNARLRRDGVMDDDRLFQRKQRLHLFEASECTLRDAGDRVGRLQALPQHRLVEEDFGKTKILRERRTGRDRAR